VALGTTLVHATDDDDELHVGIVSYKCDRKFSPDTERILPKCI